MLRWKPIRYLKIFVFLAIVTLSLTACDGLGDLVANEPFVFPGLATATPQEYSNDLPTPTRRPVPTPLPTEELARPRSESPDPVAPAEELSEEEQAELARQRILTAHRNGLTVDAFRATITTENLSSGESDSFMLEFVRPDSFRMVTDDLDLIVAAGQTFSKDQTATWLVSPIEMTDRFEGLFDPFTDEQFVEAKLEELMTDVETFQLVDELSINDVSIQVFNYNEQPADDETSAQTTVWIGLDDGLLYRQVNTLVVNGDNINITTLFEYGDDIHVAAPIP